MLLNKTSKNYRNFFLIEFTKELIRNSGPYYELEAKTKQEVKDLEKEKKQRISQLKKQIFPEIQKNIAEGKLKEYKKSAINLSPKPLSIQKRNLNRPRILRIPEIRLPPTFQHLRPTPTKEGIDLVKLNPLINDPLVTEIQCDGPNTNILVRGQMGTKPTGIVLTKEEIQEVLEIFSKQSKIPLNQGVYNVVVGKFVLSAIISESVGSKFVIKKMRFNPNFAPQNN